ncbi:MAG: PfkB family carbohydrate kinase [Fimbriimonadaceae bacterium]|nr:PfkB family carbohydrate kinase [Fimbriimonadaceae bacterium]
MGEGATFAELLQAFRGVRVVVVGDVMLDEYLFGTATRISPEAPVMVVRQRDTRHVVGGAANVALNVQALGADVSLLGIVGDDEAGRLLRDAATAAGLDARFLVDPSRPTTRKTRIVANSSHQVLRVDHESTAEPDAATQTDWLATIRDAIRSANPHVVLASDYAKGALSAEVVRALVESARSDGRKLVANGKPRSATHYAGADVVSFNRPESEAILESAVGDGRAAARALGERLGIHEVVVTLGDKGLATARYAVPSVPVEVFDPAGAGDTAIATLALAYGAESSDRLSESALHLAAHTAAAVVRKVGVAVPNVQDLEAIAQIRVP